MEGNYGVIYSKSFSAAFGCDHLLFASVSCWNNSLFAVRLLLMWSLAVTCIKFGVRFGPN